VTEKGHAALLNLRSRPRRGRGWPIVPADPWRQR
jgi:hypothetical protein